MSATFKFGGGNWAVKDGYALAYNDVNNNFKPLPFDFTRASSATRVNKQGLIETVPSGKPRIDFTDNTSGHLLLEPSRTNDLQRTEEFDNSYWSKSQASITANDTVSPDGSQTADKLVEDSSTNFHRVFVSPTTTTATYTFSVFAKADEREFLVLRNNLSGANINACFNLTSGSISYNGFSGDAEIENYGNGWFRCSVTETDASGGPTTFSILLSNSAVTNNTIPSYTGDGSSGLHIWGAQLEEGSYPTSYIPTEGSSVTRVAETANGAGNSTVFNDSEGVLYLDVSALGTDSTIRQIAIGNSTNNVKFLYNSSSTAHRAIVKVGGTNVFDFTYTVSDIDFHKVAIKYKQNDFALWVNGVERGTDPNGSTPSGLSEIAFDDGSGGSDFYGKAKDVRVYNTALTDTELQNLTS